MAIADNLKLDFQVVVKGTYAPTGGTSQEVINVLSYKRTTTVNVHSNAAFITSWRTLCEASWAAGVSLNYTMDTLRIRCLNDAEDPFVDTAIGTAGGVAGESLPGFNTMVVSRGSSIRGRWAQGRTYVCGIAESQTQGNTLTAGALATLATIATKFNSAVVTAAAANNYVPSIFSQLWSQIETNPTTVRNTEQATTTAQAVIGRMASRRSRVS